MVADGGKTNALEAAQSLQLALETLAELGAKSEQPHVSYLYKEVQAAITEILMIEQVNIVIK